MTTTQEGHAPEHDPVHAAQMARLAAWERKTTGWIIVAAVLPIATAFGPDDDTMFKNTINVVCWLVFLVDLIVHMRLMPGYLRTGRGKFDLVIVLITAPWFIFFGGTSKFILVARLARLGRIVMASTRSRKLKHLANQLGNVALYALGLVLACALIVKTVEPPSSGFTTYGDAVWWAFVTITTVGYGDLVPHTSAGRVTAVILMLGGVAFLGTLAGTLSAFFGVGSDGEPLQLDEDGDVVEEEVESVEKAESATEATASDLAAELQTLHKAVNDLVSRLDQQSPGA